MSGEQTLKAEAWTLFDRIVALAAGADAKTYSNPWIAGAAGTATFNPDYNTLRKLLGVPLLLEATSQSGVPALALDVWVAYEFRRVGFDPDLVWPRATPPRILPSTLVALRQGVTREQRRLLDTILGSGKTFQNEIGVSANILGKNYVKQVDVVMSAWNTGPELMVSTKRMDSSFGKNAANRVEESYGDAKNLRSRHPQAGLGFLFSMRSTALSPQHADVAAWITDLLGKISREADTYDAVCLIVPEWTHDMPGTAEDDDDGEDPLVAAGVQSTEGADTDTLPLAMPVNELDSRLDKVPSVALRQDVVPAALSPENFFAILAHRVLDNSPINFHQAARTRLKAALEVAAPPVTS